MAFTETASSLVSFLGGMEERWQEIDVGKLLDDTREELSENYTRRELLDHLAHRSGSMSNQSETYDQLASSLLIRLHEEDTQPRFMDTMRSLQANRDVMDQARPLLDEEFFGFLLAHEEQVEKVFQETLDRVGCFLPSLFGWKTLARSYLMRANGGIRERLPHLLYRVAIYVHRDDWDRTRQAFQDMLKGRYTHATPTLFHAGTRRSQLASCFVPGSWVWTLDGIQDITKVAVGTRTVTHTGRVCAITQLHTNSRNERPLYFLNTSDGKQVTATGDHEFFVRTKNVSKGQWKRLDLLEATDYLALGDRVLEESATKTMVTVGEEKVLSIVNPLLFSYPKLMGFFCGTACGLRPDDSTTEIWIHPSSSSYYMDCSTLLQRGDTSFVVPSTGGTIGLCHSGVTAFLKSREGRTRLYQWAIENRSTAFVEGWGEAFSIPVYRLSLQEQDLLRVMTGVVMERSNEIVETPCCGWGGGRIPESLESGKWVRFASRQRLTREQEQEYPLVYSLGVQDDHSYIVNGLVVKNCFLMGTEDSVTGIFKTISDAAMISKWAGGIGIHMSNIRAKGSYIYGTNGQSNGILPMLRVYNDVSRYIDQCFTPDSPVYTSQDGEVTKPMGEVGVGDRVLNAAGELGLVTKVLRYPWSGEIYQIGPCGVTMHHDFMIDDEYRPLDEVSSSDKVVFPLDSGKVTKAIRDLGIEKKQYEGEVIDLEVEGESYVTGAGTVHNGGGKRNGAFAMYLEPWHADVMDFLRAKRNIGGAEEEKAKDLFYGLWIPDLFMERVEKDEVWSLFCPSQCPGLADHYGSEFNHLYLGYEKENRFSTQIRARDLWTEIVRSQIETGTPYMMYKDACNYRSNQKNIGTIRSSNLCVTGGTRIMTRDGNLPIGKLCDQWVEVWNGTEFQSVQVRCTGHHKLVWSIRFSHGMELSCTPEHRFFVVRDGNEICVGALDLEKGDRIAPFDLPSGEFRLDDLPDDIQRSLDWVSNNVLHRDQYSVVYSKDRESLIELLLSMQWCGVPGTVKAQTYRHGMYELQLHKEPLRRILSMVTESLQERPIPPIWMPRVRIDHVTVESIDRTEKWADTFCFTEKKTSKGMFEGIVTGQCTEIIEYSDKDEYACCNLASIALPTFLEPNPLREELWGGTEVVVFSKRDCPFCKLLHLELETAGVVYHSVDVTAPISNETEEMEWTRIQNKFDIKTVPAVLVNGRWVGGFTEVWKRYLRPRFSMKELLRVVYAVTENLNRIIDWNVYPLPETEISNKKHRPIGIGVQGLADVLGRMRLSFDEPEARALNREIFETLYFGALQASHDLAVKEGPYVTFRGSPLSEGKFHFDLTTPANLQKSKPFLSPLHDWEALRTVIQRDGVRNSLLIAPMPTASTSQILGNTECFEPWTSNMYLRRTNAGEFYVCNPLLRRDLKALDLWDSVTRDRLIVSRGSVVNLPIPVFLKQIYRTVWEIPQKSLIDMAADRQEFIDQSQSLNIFVSEPSFELLSKIHFYGWRKGLKTGCYYIRSRAPVSSVSVTVDPTLESSSTCESCSA